MYKFWEMVITLDCEHVILVTQSGGRVTLETLYMRPSAFLGGVSY